MLIIFANLGLWLHRAGSRAIALPVRVIVGAVYIMQGVAHFNHGGVNTTDSWTAASQSDIVIAQSSAIIINLADYGFPEWGTVSLGVLLFIAGALAISGTFCRVVGLIMTVLIATNLFFGLSLAGFFDNPQLATEVIQNRLLLAVCSAVLFFLGAGMFAFDDLIFSGVRKALGGDDDDKRRDRKKGADAPPL